MSEIQVDFRIVFPYLGNPLKIYHIENDSVLKSKGSSTARVSYRLFIPLFALYKGYFSNKGRVFCLSIVL